MRDLQDARGRPRPRATHCSPCTEAAVGPASFFGSHFLRAFHVALQPAAPRGRGRGLAEAVELQERVAQSLSRVMLNTHLALARLHLHHLVLRNRLRVNCRINLVPSMARK